MAKFTGDKGAYLALCDEVKYHMNLYYNECAPIISDQDFDIMMKTLKACEKEHPEWITPDSPTQIVNMQEKIADRTKVTHTKALNKLLYFCGRDQMNIEGLSDQKLQFMLDKGYITSEFSSIFKLGSDSGSLKNLANEDGWGQISVDNLVNALDKARHTTFIRFIAALGIPTIGHGQAKLLKETMINLIRTDEKVRHFALEAENGTPRAIFNALFYANTIGFDFSSIEGFGPVIANNLKIWLDSVSDDFNDLYTAVYFDADEDCFMIEEPEINRLFA